MPDPMSKAALRQHYRALRDAVPEADRRHRSDVICSLAMTVDRL